MNTDGVWVIGQGLAEPSHDRRESADLVLAELTAVSVLEQFCRACFLGDLYAALPVLEFQSVAP